MGIDPQQYREWYGVLPGRSNGPSITEPELMVQSVTDTATAEEQNAAINKWGSMVQRFMQGATTVLSHGKEGTASKPGRTEKKLDNSIRTKTRLAYGAITSLTFMFERHGVFVHKGVGRGYKMQGGMVIRNAKVEDPDTRQMLSRNDRQRPRESYEWFNPIIRQSLPELANKLAEINADAVLNSTRMMIR